MIRSILAAAAALLLAGCEPSGGAVSSTPNPVARTEIDERAIALAFGTAEELMQLSATLRRQGNTCCQPGTPSAIRVAGLLDATADYLKAASAAQKLANHGLAELNLREAYVLLAKVRAVVAHREGDAR